MPRYRKKPVVIEAVKLDWSTWCEICEFVPGTWFCGGVYLDEKTLEEAPGSVTSKMGLKINTLKGIMLAR